MLVLSFMTNISIEFQNSIIIPYNKIWLYINLAKAKVSSGLFHRTGLNGLTGANFSISTKILFATIFS